MKHAFFISGILLCAASFGATGLKTLDCREVLGPSYEVAVAEGKVNLIEIEEKSLPKAEFVKNIRHTFPLAACKFTDFSVDLTCQDETASLKVALSPVTKNGETYHVIRFNIAGAENMKSANFEMFRIEQGKNARCVVNDLFEIL
jgi:hypothetical protein